MDRADPHGDDAGDGDSGMAAGGAPEIGNGGNPEMGEDPSAVSDAPEGYPDGPYAAGNPMVGEVIENLTFEGYPRIGDSILSSEGTVQRISLADLRDSDARYALIHTATVWCPSCRTAADDLALRGDELSASGAAIIELVLEGGYDVLPTDEQLALWIEGSDLTVTTVRPADERTPLVFPSREYVYIVELDTMQVVWAEQALFTDPTITEQGIEALLEYL